MSQKRFSWVASRTAWAKWRTWVVARVVCLRVHTLGRIAVLT